MVYDIVSIQHITRCWLFFTYISLVYLPVKVKQRNQLSHHFFQVFYYDALSHSNKSWLRLKHSLFAVINTFNRFITEVPGVCLKLKCFPTFEGECVIPATTRLHGRGDTRTLLLNLHSSFYGRSPTEQTEARLHSYGEHAGSGIGMAVRYCSRRPFGFHLVPVYCAALIDIIDSDFTLRVASSWVSRSYPASEAGNSGDRRWSREAFPTLLSALCVVAYPGSTRKVHN